MYLSSQRMNANSVSSVVPALQSTACILFLPKDGHTNKSQLKWPTFTTTKKGLVVWKKSLVCIVIHLLVIHKATLLHAFGPQNSGILCLRIN